MNEIYVGASNGNVQVKPSAPTYNGFQLRTVDGGSGPTRADFLNDLRKIKKEPKKAAGPRSYPPG
jgi:hypothetical protein